MSTENITTSPKGLSTQNTGTVAGTTLSRALTKPGVTTTGSSIEALTISTTFSDKEKVFDRQ